MKKKNLRNVNPHASGAQRSCKQDSEKREKLKKQNFPGVDCFSGNPEFFRGFSSNGSQHNTNTTRNKTKSANTGTEKHSGWIISALKALKDAKRE